MNVYDFDRTIYNGDSTVDFFLYSLKNNPALLCYFPKQALGFLLYFFKRINKTQMKEYFFSFLNGIDCQRMVDSFWEQKQDKIYDWYRKQQKQDDIIISASPTFLLKPVCSSIGVQYLIASEVDPKTGIFTGENCRGQEKVKRLAAVYHITHIDSLYSDSRSDLPLVNIADTAFLVRKGVVKKWKGSHAHEQR